MAVASRPHLAFPARLGPDGRFVVNEQDTDAEVADSIAIVLLWPQGTRESIPDFGVPNQLFHSGGVDPLELRTAVVASEPRAEGRRIALNGDELEDGFEEVELGFDQGGTLG